MSLIAHSRVFVPLAAVLALSCLVSAGTAGEPEKYLVPSDSVGRVGENRYVLPTGQALTPRGRQIELPGARPQALALSPDGQILIAVGRSNLLMVMEAKTGEVLQRVPLSTNRTTVKPQTRTTDPDDPASVLEFAPAETTNTTGSGSSTNRTEGTNATNRTSGTNAPSRASGANTNSVTSVTNATGRVTTTNTALISVQPSFTGLVFSPDGRHIYLSIAGGTLRSFPVDAKNRVGRPMTLPMPELRGSRSKKEIPTGLAVSADNRRLYVVGNVANKLHELEADTGKALRSWDTGVAPFEVVLVGTKAYVSNLGGRRTGTNDVKAPTGRGSSVRVDATRHIPMEGSVTVIDLAEGTVKTEIVVESHASALAVSPDRQYVVVANTGSDTLSVIEVKTDQVVEKIWARQTPADLFGAQPNALAFDKKGKRLYVCNGTQNAVAVVEFEPKERTSRVIGLVPVGWFPGAIIFDATHKNLCVANIKGLGALRVFKPGDKIKLTTKDFYGAISLVPVPASSALPALTALARQNMSYPKLAEAKLPARPGQPARPVPERVGEPSLFKHVIYVIKENRSYDQVLGDMSEGNGHPGLCIFGEKYTPNQHKIAREFVLLDNTYCSGVQSADGHQWTDSAIANEYVERQLIAGFPRSYPGAKVQDGVDALAWSASGFLWDNALAHGKSFRNYGEWMISDAGWRERRGRRDKARWKDFWNDYTTGTNLTRLASHPGIETLRPYSPTNTVGWDLLVPDVMRAAFFIQELRQYEIKGGFPDFTLLFLPNDHTGGTRGRAPTPGAQVADNDLAFGRVVEAVTQSKFWPRTCLIAIEDDPQNGWDHVSGYRTTCYVVSPYTKRRQTIHTQYNQTSVVRTLELILGLPPMNQLDATATPMSDCFTDTPDLTPFKSVPNRVPLDQANPEPRKIADRLLRQDALASERLKLDQPDLCSEDVLNRILWRAMKGSDVPYPEWAVKGEKDDD